MDGLLFNQKQNSPLGVRGMKKIKVTQVKSVIDRSERQKRTMVALGLRKMNASVEVEATIVLFWRSDRSITLLTCVTFIFFIHLYFCQLKFANCQFIFYPLNTFFKEIPRVFATAIGSRNVANALNVAFTTL